VKKMKTVLCFGDSNTFGEKASGGRFERWERWTGQVQKELGDEYYIIEEGCGGRTTVWDDPIEEHKNGKKYLIPCLHSHMPLDLVVIMLGTNDLKNRFSLSALDIAYSIENIILSIYKENCGKDARNPSILLISPPQIENLTKLADILIGAKKKREELSGRLETLAGELRVHFLDAASCVTIDPQDGVHMDLQGHAALANVISERIVQILNDDK